MKKVLLIAAAVLFILAAAGCGGRNGEFGYVDMQKVMQESAKVKEIQEKIDQKTKQMSDLTEKEDADFEKEKTTLKGADLEKRQTEMQEQRQIRQGEMMSLVKEAEQEFKGLLDKAMDEVMRDKKLGAVLIKNSVLSGGLDVTEDVLKKLN